MTNYQKKYLKYKQKYLNLKNLKNNQSGGTHTCSMCSGDSCLKTIHCYQYQISQIPDSSIQINQTIQGDESKKSELIIIPGFSDSSYNRNYKSLFKFYQHKLNPMEFKKIHLVKFQDDDIFSIRKLHLSFFDADNKIIDPILENNLYQKCAQIIKSKLDSESLYTILAKSAGGGVGIYLSELIPQQIHKLLLFAPGAEFVNMDLKILSIDNSKVTVGWNIDDTKVPMGKIWPKLSIVLPNTKVLTYTKDSYIDPTTQKPEDTQHEINSKFIVQIIE
jgi:hypothetical protein